MVNPIFYLLVVIVAFCYPLGIEPLYFLREGHNTVSGMHITPFSIIICTSIYVGWLALSYAIWGKDATRIYRLKNINRSIAFIIYSIIIFVFHLPTYLGQNSMFEEYQLTKMLKTLMPFLMLAGLNDLAASNYVVKMRPDISLHGLLTFHLRTFLAFALAPVFLMLLATEVMQNKIFFMYPALDWLIGILIMVALIMSAPLLFKITLGTKPIAKGEIRDVVENICARANFKPHDLVVVNTYGGKIGNAFITGLGRWRTIFFTDFLLENLTPDEVVAVASHEIMHSKRRHILYLLFLSIVFVAIATLMANSLGNSIFGGPALITLALIFWFGLFGYISRRFETEADIYGAKVIGSVEGFISALSKIAFINGMPIRGVGGLRHFSIAKRADLLRSVFSSEPALRKFQKMLNIITATIIAAFIASMVYMCWTLFGAANGGNDLKLWEAAEKAKKGEQYFNSGEFEITQICLESAIKGGFNPGEVYLLLSKANIELGNFSQAKGYFIQAQSQHPQNPLTRLELENLSEFFQKDLDKADFMH